MVMTHGPPLFREHSNYNLDVNQDGKNCGCEKLASAIRRVKPRLHCFGHIHEGCGVMKMDWGADESTDAASDLNSRKDCLRVDGLAEGKETLFVNAAVSDCGGWLIDLDL